MDALQHLDTTQLVALAAALGWASGLRLYAVLLITGLAGYLGWVPLPGGLHVLQHPAVLAASGFMFVLEFLADKVPGLWVRRGSRATRLLLRRRSKRAARTAT